MGYIYDFTLCGRREETLMGLFFWKKKKNSNTENSENAEQKVENSESTTENKDKTN